MPEITKRKVTMRNPVVAGYTDDGEPIMGTHEAVDYVRPDFLDAYVADANTRWAYVHISDEPDAGPGGYDGATWIPDHLDHPDAGTTYEATKGGKK